MTRWLYSWLMAFCVVSGALGVGLPGVAAAATVARHTTAAQRQSLVVIVYGDFGLVRDVRRVTLDRGENRIVFDDVSPQMSPETVYLSDLSSGAPVWVHEQNYETAALTPDAILNKAVGHTVLVIRYNDMTGRETRERAILVSTNGPILRFADRTETGLPPSSRIAYISTPAMSLTPGFLTVLDSPSSGAHSIAIGYLTGGLSWSADYVGRVDPSDDHLDIDAFITLSNTTGMSFDNAAFRVVAGNVQRMGAVPPTAAAEVRTLGRVTTSNVYASNAGRPMREPVSEFYQYTLSQRTTLGIGETKQLLLFFARAIPLRQIYQTGAGNDFQSQSGDEQRPQVQWALEFDNDGHGLGIPLPSGVVHLYKNDQSGEQVFIGEDSIPNTPRKEVVSLDLGQSFDITVRRVQTDYREVAHLNAPTEYITEYRVTVKNAKARSIVLRYTEQINGQWQITGESQRHQKLSSSTVRWMIPVPAYGQTVLTFQVDTH